MVWGGYSVRSLLVLSLVLVLSVWPYVQAVSPPGISAIADLVYDADFASVLAEKHGYLVRSISIITKVMTVFLGVELVKQGKVSLYDKVTASARAESRDGTQIKLRAGDTFTVEELLYASALQSANDAAVALAEFIGGTEGEFAKMMTARAHELGLKDTNYVDCTGLLSIFSDNYSTAYDQARLFQIAMEHELFREIFATIEYDLKAQGRKIGN